MRWKTSPTVDKGCLKKPIAQITYDWKLRVTIVVIDLVVFYKSVNSELKYAKEVLIKSQLSEKTKRVYIKKDLEYDN